MKDDAMAGRAREWREGLAAPLGFSPAWRDVDVVAFAAAEVERDRKECSGRYMVGMENQVRAEKAEAEVASLREVNAQLAADAVGLREALREAVKALERMRVSNIDSRITVVCEMALASVRGMVG